MAQDNQRNGGQQNGNNQRGAPRERQPQGAQPQGAQPQGAQPRETRVGEPDIRLSDIFGSPVNEANHVVPGDRENGRPQPGGHGAGEQGAGRNELPGGQRGRQETVERITAARVEFNDEAISFMEELFEAGDADEIDDVTARQIAGQEAQIPRRPRHEIGPERPVPTAENLPALVSRALQAENIQLQPRWSQVRHLPGYVQSQIRRLGRDVFRQFTQTPLEDIQILSTVISGETEVRGIAGWIKRNGVREGSVEMTFGRGPGVKADVTLWRTEDFSFLLVKDFSGYHVYGWPGGRGVHLAHDARQQLGHDGAGAQDVGARNIRRNPGNGVPENEAPRNGPPENEAPENDGGEENTMGMRMR